MSFFQDWIKSMPPVTRSYVIISSLTTLGCALDFISPLKLYLSWTSIIQRYQIWRIFSNFFFFGSFGLDFFFHMFFLYRYCKLLEMNSFRGKTADFLYMLLFGAFILLLVSPLVPNILFLGQSLTFMMVYVWARRNEHQIMNFLGLFNFRAPYLPWVLLVFSLILGSSPVIDLLGIMSGHLYYYLVDVYPVISGGVRILKTPALFYYLVGNNDDMTTPQPPRARRHPFNQVFGWGQGRHLQPNNNQNQNDIQNQNQNENQNPYQNENQNPHNE